MINLWNTLMKILASLILCLFLTGCYETVGEKTEREKLERRIHDLERAR